MYPQAGPGPQQQYTWAVPPSPTPVMQTGAPLASLGKRFGGHMLDGLLMLVTLFVGWLIWSFVLYSQGQTPAKSLLKMRVAHRDTGAPLSWGQMFMREFVVKVVLLNAVSAFTLGIAGIVAPLFIFFGPLRQTLWDRALSTVVVDESVQAPVVAYGAPAAVASQPRSFVI